MSAPTILLLGRNGQVGWELQRSLSVLGRVVALDDGLLHLFYAAGVSIGEATSSDGGATWTVIHEAWLRRTDKALVK